MLKLHGEYVGPWIRPSYIVESLRHNGRRVACQQWRGLVGTEETD